MAIKEAEELLEQYRSLRRQKTITIENLNPNDKADQFLMLEIALRGKTADDYFKIVDGLFRPMRLKLIIGRKMLYIFFPVALWQSEKIGLA